MTHIFLRGPAPCPSVPSLSIIPAERLGEADHLQHFRADNPLGHSSRLQKLDL